MVKLGRLCFGITSLLAFIGIGIELIESANYTGSVFLSVTERVLNVFVYFTTQSNLIVALTTLLLVFTVNRNSKVFQTFRLTGVVGIFITALIYHTLLAGTENINGWGVVSDIILHSIVPFLAILGWVIYGPRNLISKKVAVWSLVFPLLWLAFTLIRGALTKWYPYPFIDVTLVGYSRVSINLLGITGLYLILTAAAYLLDRRLSKSK